MTEIKTVKIAFKCNLCGVMEEFEDFLVVNSNKIRIYVRNERITTCRHCNQRIMDFINNKDYLK